MNKNKFIATHKKTLVYAILAVFLIFLPTLFKLIINKDIDTTNESSKEVLPSVINKDNPILPHTTILSYSGKSYKGNGAELTKDELNNLREVVSQPFIFDPLAYHHMWPVNNPLCKSPSIIEENFNLKLYTACNELAQQEGLKMIKDMPENQGMLFIYPTEKELNFWMNQTYSPLSIAYLDKDFKVVHVAEMIPLDKTGISSIVPAQYALELNKNRMQELGISEGVTLSFKPSQEKLSFIPEKRIEDQDYELQLFMEYHNK